MKNTIAGVKKILIVEDEPVICEVCQRVIAMDGSEADVAANGEVALDRIQKKDYDLILIDIMTPVMSGKELYRHIVEKYPHLETRTIFTTGDVMGGDTRRFLKLAGRPFLPKPFTVGELKTIVRETLGQAEG